MVVRHPRQRPGAIATALERVPLPVFTIDGDGRVDWLNKAGRELFGDKLGQRYTSFFAPESLGRAQTAFTRKRIGETQFTEYDAVVVTAEGGRLHAEVSSVSLEEDGHFVGVFGLIRPEDELPSPKPLLQELTPRQAEVLRLLARGYSTRQMAGELGISVDTVRNHTRDLLQRLDAHSRLSAVVVARERGLL